MESNAWCPRLPVRGRSPSHHQPFRRGHKPCATPTGIQFATADSLRAKLQRKPVPYKSLAQAVSESIRLAPPQATFFVSMARLEYLLIWEAGLSTALTSAEHSS